MFQLFCWVFVVQRCERVFLLFCLVFAVLLCERVSGSCVGYLLCLCERVCSCCFVGYLFGICCASV